ncbi:MAG: DUF86 domain-containing protein [Candidatus Caenarcaniphilales bacterium]|nr:DUF86 domain-containing protein [Candidatus Caenarcaniphilales bacterium]
MSKKDSIVLLEDILDSIEQIQKYVLGLDFDKFENNRLVIDAVVRNLEIIGEASKLLTEDFRRKYTNIPWVKIIATRNKVIHEYGSVNLEIVWGIIEKELPRLKDEFTALLIEIKRNAK